MKNLVYFLFILICLVSSCDSKKIYEKNKDIIGNDWYIDSIYSFSFSITNTKNPTNIYLNIRNGVSYPYTNLYIRYHLINPSQKEEKIDLYNVMLFDDKTGEPLGDGLGDLFDHQILILPDYQFKQPGNYIIKVQQYMRKNPLPFIMSLGIRVEEK